MGHDPENLPDVVIARDGHQPRLQFSTDSPLRTTEGDLESMAPYAGHGAERIDDICPVGHVWPARLRAETRASEGCEG